MLRIDIYWIRLDPIEGAEIGKTRPAVVISNDINNEFADTVTIIPITSKTGKVYPFEVLIPEGMANLPEDSKVKTNQIRTVDKKRVNHPALSDWASCFIMSILRPLLQASIPVVPTVCAHAYGLQACVLFPSLFGFTWFHAENKRFSRTIYCL